jgi:2-oxo-4-hydroxy-4-carboxy-5-ureidoimidazoline decarboxylase
MSDVLTRWNRLPQDEAEYEILPCCGSREWAHRTVIRRPFADEAQLLEAAGEEWRNLGERDWDEAFRSHPRIGETRAALPAHAQSAAWSAQEQREAADPGDEIKIALSDANREYEERFSRIFIVCASGKTATEMLAILRRRLQNDRETELREAVEQQRQIIELRIGKWLGK